MNIFVVITFCGAIASIIGLLLPTSGRHMKLVHVIYGPLIVVLAVPLLNYRNQLDEIHNIEGGARQLLRQEDMMGNESFIHATLAFLEKYKSHFPDAYKRAQKICDLNETLLSNDKSTDNIQHAWSKIEVASCMSGVLEGIATANSNP